MHKREINNIYLYILCIYINVYSFYTFVCVCVGFQPMQSFSHYKMDQDMVDPTNTWKIKIVCL